MDGLVFRVFFLQSAEQLLVPKRLGCRGEGSNPAPAPLSTFNELNVGEQFPFSSVIAYFCFLFLQTHFMFHDS